MEKQLETVLKDYNRQTAYNMLTAEQKALTNVNEVQLPYNEVDGLFTDCCLERPVLNLTLNPMRSVLNSIPIRPSVLQASKYAFLSGIDDVQGTRPVAPCDEPQYVCDLQACYMEIEKGRTHFGTKTIEIDAIIEKLCRGVHEDLFLVGDVRGVSGGFTMDMLPDSNLIQRGAARRAIQLIGREMQRELVQQVWTGDPVNNTAQGGWKEFYGLSFLVADDYGTAAKDPIVSGTNCEQLNSDIKDFSACIGEVNADGYGIYEIMQTLEETLFNKAMLQGHTSVNWKWVMPSLIWSELVKFLSCEMISLGCVTPATNGVQVTVNDGSATQMANELRRTMRIPVNGRAYDVIIDDGLPYTSDGATPPTYTSDIYFLPFSVDGIQTLFAEHKDYRALGPALSPISTTDMHGFSEGGRFFHIVRHNGMCITVETKTELSLWLLAPHLAGKIENVSACRLQAMPTAFPPA